MKPKTTHGGARPGTGPKPLHGTPMRRYNMLLDEATVEGAKIIGDGNLSLGIRLAVHAIMLMPEPEPEPTKSPDC